ncbi:MAG TPA: anthranilate phosphoribosyltransferase [Bacteroidia bacterium]|jgi:anthranilate phosphoribosyltransferase|nr:anthranilate phosphoribosyltransferase [Bacteroidia bacterium]
MKKVLEKLFAHETLSAVEAGDVIARIASGEGSDAQVAAFMTVYLMRPVTPEELAGFRSALLSLCAKVNLPNENAIDLCGTGGDDKNTFNISTTSAFVVAGAGGKVIKHGNYGVSSVSGSSNVLEHFGYKFTTDESKLKNSLEETGVCFLHAPLFHPALKRVGPIRKELGIKTFFNMLGPLVNPAQPSHRVNGVFSLELARVYHYLAQDAKEKYVILHGTDGYDELSLTSSAKLFTANGEEMVSAESFGLNRIQPIEILGGATPQAAAAIFRNVLQHKATEAQTNVVLANAALALNCLGLAKDLKEGVELAKESIQSGSAERSFKRSLEINN